MGNSASQVRGTGFGHFRGRTLKSYAEREPVFVINSFIIDTVGQRMNHEPAKPALGHVLDVFGQAGQGRTDQGIGGNWWTLINGSDVDRIFVGPLVRMNREVNIALPRRAVPVLHDIIKQFSQDN